MSDLTQAKVQAVDEQVSYNWRIGTGFHDAGQESVWSAALNRTHLIADVWGWSNNTSQGSRQTPEVTFGCLSPIANITLPGNNTTTSNITTLASTMSKTSTSISHAATAKTVMVNRN